MKKLFATTIFLFILTNSAIAQPIVSIGGLTIGMTEQDFLEIPEIKSRNIQDVGNKNSKDSDVWKKTADSNVPEYRKIYTPEYIIYEFKMATGVKGHMGRDSYDATVEFYKNELISISLDLTGQSLEFNDILTEKYGKPVFKNTMTKKTCQNAYGAKTEHLTGYISKTWGGNNQVSALMLTSSSNCDKESGTSYSVSNKKSSIVR